MPRFRKQRELTRVRFISESTPPASRLRVLIRNISKGFEGDPVPFSDREYSEQEGSEDLKLEFSKRHNGKFLALSLEGETLKNHPVSDTTNFPAKQPGINASQPKNPISPKPVVLTIRPPGVNFGFAQLISSSEINNSFEYEIRRGIEVVETGTFTVIFEKQLWEANRYKIWVRMRVPEGYPRSAIPDTIAGYSCTEAGFRYID